MAHEVEFRRRKRHTPSISTVAVLALLMVVVFAAGNGEVALSNEAFMVNVPYLDFNGPGLPDIRISR